MMTDTEFDVHANAPMAKLLSPLLMVAQWVFGVFFVLFLLMAFIMAVPSGFRDSLLAESTTQIDPTVLMGRCLAGAVVAVGWFFVLKLLRGVVSAVIHGDPFLPQNIARLRNIWVIFAVTEIFRMIAFFLMGGDGPAEGGSQLDIRLGTWFFIFVIVVISEAFRHGAALRADQELTI
jgi:hypothetical protein